MRSRLSPVLRVLFLFSLLTAAAVARAEWPDRPIKLIVPYAAGSGVDVTMRPIAEVMGRELGQPVVLDNRGSAGGIVGTQVLAASAPDGYTIGYGNLVTLAINRAFYTKLPYDPEKDIEPVGLAVSNAYVLIARKDFPASNLEELIAYARKHPGKVVMGSPGVGSAGQLAGELINASTGTVMLHVPYKSGAQALGDIVNGQVDIMIDNISAVQQFIQSGRVKPLAVTSLQRASVLPNVPTIDESGIKGFNVVAWGGVVAPAGTPKAVIRKLNAALNSALRDPAVVRANALLSVDAMPSTPAEFSTLIHSEVPKWAASVKRAGVRAD
ncbi:Bug family tripartite tricarboxylate transporter substrate binding protein [Cupriavidus basilensis]|uniref:Bug family tripartite tricarboxylate transporter substrate binding protein n=1 Tax=Cupriavidus basilensis TaxID=68895 RepID=UPI00283BDAC3|nr:tripartite tricarboxylate transporter substrate binding protein [Cupriavidus basilensis]MDR3379863.1 tripartite tricarboxylate transporter substrate binding protein [Cupriavidus basilensis]